MRLSLVMISLALESILKNKMRAMLTMLGIVIGVAAVIVMVAVGYGARSRIREQISLTGRLRIPQILASTASVGDITAAQEEIGMLLRESYHISDDEEDDSTVRNQTDLATAAESSTRVMTLLMAAIASISLLGGRARSAFASRSARAARTC